MKDLVFHLKNELHTIQHILFFSLAIAFLFTLLTQSLSREYFALISITASGTKSGNSQAPVVWMAFPDISELQRGNLRVEKTKGWETEKGVFVSTRNQPAELRLAGNFRRTFRLEFIESPYSGRMELEINGTKKKLDLFQNSQATKIIRFDKYFHEPSLLPVLFRFLNHFARNALLLIAVSVALYSPYRRITLLHPRSSTIEETASFRRSRRTSLLVAILIFGLFTIAFYPGVMTDDSVDQYTQAMRFQFNDWHPPMLAAIWSVTNHIIRGPGGMFLLHLAMLCYSAYLLSLVAVMKGRKHSFLPLLAILLPVVSCISFYIVKDVSFAYSLLLAYSLWYFWRITGKLNKTRLLVIIAIVFYASSVRLNSVTAIVPLLFLFLLNFTSKRTAAFCSLLTAVFFILVNTYLTYNVFMARRSYVSQVIMAHDLMSIYDITGSNYLPKKYLPRERLDQLMKQFSPLDSNATTWIERPFLSSDPQIASQLKNQWMGAILEQPKAYLVHRWNVFKYFLVAVDPWLYDYHVPASWNSTQVPLLIGENLPGKIYKKSGRWLRNNASLAFQALTYLIILLLILVVSIRKKIRESGVLAVSAVLYLITYFFFAPGSDYRYIYWPVCAVLLSICVLWMAKESFGLKKAPGN